MWDFLFGEKVVRKKEATYTESDLVDFGYFLSKNYVRIKGYYYMKGDWERKWRISIPTIVEHFKQRKL